MKTNKYQLFFKAILLIFFITSCTKDNSISSCKLIKFINTGNGQTHRSYSYDSQNNLSQIIIGDNFKTYDFEYLNGQVNKVITSFTLQTDSCLVDVYLYDSTNKLIKIDHQYSNNSNCSDPETVGTTEYFYTNESLDSTVLIASTGQNVLEYDKVLSVYDENENVLKIERFIQDELYYTTTYAYDDSINLLYGYLQNGKNNATIEDNVIPSMQLGITFSYRYEDLNELNVPTKMFERNSSDIYSEKEYEYKLQCD